MGHFLRTLVLALAIFGAGWLTGDRYGVDGWIARAIDPVFAFVDPLFGEDADLTASEPSTTPEQEASEHVAAAPERSSEETADSAPNNEGTLAEDDRPVAMEGSANAQLRTNQAGIDILKESEGLRLDAYESGGRLYEGYGHQIQEGEPTHITEAEAEEFLRSDLARFEEFVYRALTQPANENEFSAMVTLAYGIGTGRFADSTVLRKFNEGDKQAAADGFLLWVKAGGQVVEGLKVERERQRALFLTPVD